MAFLRIGELADAAGVKLTTVRFYERCGLVPKPVRNAAGYRQYSADAVNRICFIKNAQELGFSLEEIAELLTASSDTAAGRDIIKSRIAEKINMIDNRISMLQEVKETLENLYESCPGDGSIDDGCPILDALSCKCS